MRMSAKEFAMSDSEQKTRASRKLVFSAAMLNFGAALMRLAVELLK